MLQRLLYYLAVTTLLLLCHECESVQADDLVTFPYENKTCTCSGLSCTCCQGVQVPTLGLNKNVCLQFTLKILPVSVTVNIQMDNKTIVTFVIDPKNPPTYCIPVILPGDVAMCIKLHDIKLVGLTGVQICSTIYASVQTDQIFSAAMPCVKLGTDGITVLNT